MSIASNVKIQFQMSNFWHLIYIYLYLPTCLIHKLRYTMMMKIFLFLKKLSEFNWCRFLSCAFARWCSCGFFRRTHGLESGLTIWKNRQNVGWKEVLSLLLLFFIFNVELFSDQSYILYYCGQIKLNILECWIW